MTKLQHQSQTDIVRSGDRVIEQLTQLSRIAHGLNMQILIFTADCGCTTSTLTGIHRHDVQWRGLITC